MRTVTATCSECGTVEQSTYAGPSFRCQVCTARFVAHIRLMAEDGMSQGQIAAKLGCTQNSISRWCIKSGIVTGGAKPQQNIGAVHGIGQAPAKLMPSRRALGRVSIWGLGVHASIEKLSPKKSFVNV